MGTGTKILATALAVTIVVLLFLADTLQGEIKEHAKTQAALTTSQESLDAYIHAIEVMSENQIRLEKAVSLHQNNYNLATRKLVGLKDREVTVLAKKGLVELKINKAYNKQQNRLACITGDNTACGE